MKTMHVEKAVYADLDTSAYGRKNVEDLLALLYHENSKFCSFTARLQGEHISAFYNPYFIERSSQPYKRYPGCERIDMSMFAEAGLPDINFFSLLQNRRSVRDYQADYSLSLYELYILLNQSYGVTHRVKIEAEGVDGHYGWRNVPSAGGLYPLEIYVCLLNSQVGQGLYHYRADSNELEVLKEGNFLENMENMINATPYINLANASAVIFTTGMIERMAIKYGERSYRFMLHESGFVSQSLSLIGESLGLGSCMVGSYLDDKIGDFLEIDGVFESVQNVMVIGKK